MQSETVSAAERRLRERAERHLGSQVIAIEFTLISVMVGVILFPLMDYATPVLRDLKFEYVPYIASGLILILYLWTEVIAHSLSFIGWPIDILHNLFYILFATLLAIQMHFLQDPLGWFSMTALSAAAGAAVVYYDLKVIEERRRGATGAAAALFESAWQRQRTLLRTVPFTLANALVQAALVLLFPSLFIAYHLHLALVTIQIAAFTFLIQRTIRQFKAQREAIVRRVEEELAGE